VRKISTSKSFFGKIQTAGAAIKPEKQAHFTDFECKVEN
jgi:hypothetical protein